MKQHKIENDEGWLQRPQQASQTDDDTGNNYLPSLYNA